MRSPLFEVLQDFRDWLAMTTARMLSPSVPMEHPVYRRLMDRAPDTLFQGRLELIDHEDISLLPQPFKARQKCPFLFHTHQFPASSASPHFLQRAHAMPDEIPLRHSHRIHVPAYDLRYGGTIQ
ncbi:MAG: hypothetical protein LBQ62_06770, partial [Candidatus Accumulibacter sp.]|nr:hypothetical protein [Accumulibacter sp.]